MYLYSALFVVPHTQGAQAWITQCYLQLLLIYLPRKDERLSRPGWLTYSGQFTHISGHPSAACRAQDRKVRRSKTNILPRCHATNDWESWKGRLCLWGIWGCKRTMSLTGTRQTWSTERHSDRPDGQKMHFGSGRHWRAWIRMQDPTNSATHGTRWFPGHMLHRAVNNQDVIKMSDGHRNVVIR